MRQLFVSHLPVSSEEVHPLNLATVDALVDFIEKKKHSVTRYRFEEQLGFTRSVDAKLLDMVHELMTSDDILHKADHINARFYQCHAKHVIFNFQPWDDVPVFMMATALLYAVSRPHAMILVKPGSACQKLVRSFTDNSLRAPKVYDRLADYLSPATQGQLQPA